jgi:CreA protein
MNSRRVVGFTLALLLPFMAASEEIGSVTTTFKMLGANHKIVIEAFDDPVVKGVSCHLKSGEKRRPQRDLWLG